MLSTNVSPSLLLHLLPSAASFTLFHLVKILYLIIFQHCIGYLLIQSFHEEVHDFFQVEVEGLFYHLKNTLTNADSTATHSKAIGGLDPTLKS